MCVCVFELWHYRIRNLGKIRNAVPIYLDFVISWHVLGLWTLSLFSLVTEGGWEGINWGGRIILGIWSNGLRILSLRI